MNAIVRSFNILWHCLSSGLEWKLTFSSTDLWTNPFNHSCAQGLLELSLSFFFCSVCWHACQNLRLWALVLNWILETEFWKTVAFLLCHPKGRQWADALENWHVSPPGRIWGGVSQQWSRAELLRIRVCAGPALLSSGRRWSPDELLLLLLSCQVVSDSATSWAAALQASLYFTISWSLLRLVSIESVMPDNHLILCCPCLLLPSIFPSMWVFSNESTFCIRWSEYWSFSLSPSEVIELWPWKNADIFHLLGVFVP